MPCQHDDVPSGIPRELRVEVRVDVDEARCHREAVGVDGARAAATDPADFDDAVALDRDVAGERVGSGAVDDRSALDHQVVWQWIPSYGDRRASGRIRMRFAIVSRSPRLLRLLSRQRRPHRRGR